MAARLPQLLCSRKLDMCRASFCDGFHFFSVYQYLLRYKISRDLQRNLIQRSPQAYACAQPSTDISKAEEYRNGICGRTCLRKRIRQRPPRMPRLK